ncbi:MAG: hypothetical protein IJN47_06550, partial [Clostridia bacterium]|nr:hypothetical protein [Clostridia bacterium]
MYLNIDGRRVLAGPDKPLRELIAEAGMDAPSLKERPLAAKIAGEVFTLNYIPLRSKDANADRPSIRRAMEASGGEVRLLRYGDAAGKEAYIRTAQFAIFLALRQLWPQARAKMTCTLGASVFIAVHGADDFSAQLLKERLRALVEEDIPLVRRRVPLSTAEERYRREGQLDKARLLAWRTVDYFDEYFYGDFADYYYGEMLPSTGYLKVWDLLPADGGVVLVYPDDLDPDRCAGFSAMPNFFSVFSEGERWCQLMECETVADLNDLTLSGKIRELIRVNEALHEKRYSQVADMICQRNARAGMLAGPSSSGKTTSANRLATQLRVHGKKPVLMSLDDYYLDRDQILPGPDGKLDLEHIDTIDTKLFRSDMEKLLRGEEVELPSFLASSIRYMSDTVSPLALIYTGFIIYEIGLKNLRILPGLPAVIAFRFVLSPLLTVGLCALFG